MTEDEQNFFKGDDDSDGGDDIDDFFTPRYY